MLIVTAHSRLNVKMAQSQGDTETTSAGAAVAATEDQASIAG